ncbi:LysR family transcriptional regulator [Bradyrhizobium canariense]|uniref:Transcriptional regulator, LysR family n=1 Tax=Bradyrhizobium canariense TaxID=255045 RepID=A0A1H1M1E4_9BRAD|nr:LysR family transcriptional regulator [Bradyrhizobium canariense]SDR80698.1 transcriptional regulator, LysR family [Bradyrhizobium canariense]
MDRLEAMSILIHAAEAGSLSKASRLLGLPLATVSRKVSELEAHLNTSLLTRSAKGLTPTPAGRSFLANARIILDQLNEAERAAAGEYIAPKGELVITAPVVFGRLHVLPVVTDFLSAYPEVDVSLVLTDRVTHLVDDRVDLAVRIGDLPDSSLTASRVGSVRRVVCASPSYFAERGHPVSPDELVRHTGISHGGLSAPSVWRFEANGVEVATEIRSRLSVNTVEAAIDAAVAGVGLARPLSYQIVERIRQGTLALTLEAFRLTPSPVQLLYNGQSRLPLKLRAFLDFVAPRLRQRLTEAEL